MAVLDWKDIREAAAVIRSGGLVAMPTETVYGLAADATDDSAVARIYAAKERPGFNPLIVHVSDREMAARYAAFTPLASALADAFWPGPLTLVLERRRDCALSLLVSAGLNTVAVRAPAAEIARALIRTADRPLAAPSANRSGAVSPTRAAHVRESLGERVDFILDGGPCPVGVESTIVKCSGDDAVILRAGGVTRDEIERVLGRKVPTASGGGVEAPGMLASHYATAAPLRLGAAAPEMNEVYIAFGPAPAGHPHTLQLSETQDLPEAAANLFAHLHAADRMVADRSLAGIAVAPIPRDGLGEAIIDRLARAAAPRG